MLDKKLRNEIVEVILAKNISSINEWRTYELIEIIEGAWRDGCLPISDSTDTELVKELEECLEYMLEWDPVDFSTEDTKSIKLLERAKAMLQVEKEVDNLLTKPNR